MVVRRRDSTLFHLRTRTFMQPALALSTIISVSCTGTNTDAQPSTPDDAVHGFIDAVAAKDVKKAATFVLGGLPDGGALGSAIAIMPPIKFRALSVTTQGDEATAAVTLLLGDRQEEKSEARLKLVAGSWKIIPDQETKGGLATLANLCTKGNLAEAMLPMFQAAKQRALATKCRTQLNEIAKAVISVVADKNGVFAIDPAKVMEQTRSYVGDDKLWQCGFKKDGKQDYSFNASLRGISVSQVHDPKNTVMVYE